MATAKVFKSGNSQAIRLPKEFRFPPETEEVAIRREGPRIVLEPVPVKEWPPSFWRAFGGVTEDFERPPQRRQKREIRDDAASS
jgi:antitoxin VapB